MKKVKIKKIYWEPKKSKFLFFRPELKSKLDLEINPQFIQQQGETIKANRLRRSLLKINQNQHPESYYADCHVNSEEYKNR